MQRGEFDNSVALLQRILNEYGEDILADDAYFLQGEIYERQLGKKKKRWKFIATSSPNIPEVYTQPKQGKDSVSCEETFPGNRSSRNSSGPYPSTVYSLRSEFTGFDVAALIDW